MTVEYITEVEGVAPVGPYSLAIRIGDTVRLAGQLPINVQKSLVGGNVTEQTRQVFRNIVAVLEAARAGLKDVVKVTVVLTDMSNFAEMNREYAVHFPKNAPTRAAFESPHLPIEGALVEIVVDEAYAPEENEA